MTKPKAGTLAHLTACIQEFSVQAGIKQQKTDEMVQITRQYVFGQLLKGVPEGKACLEAFDLISKALDKAGSYDSVRGFVWKV